MKALHALVFLALAAFATCEEAVVAKNVMLTNTNVLIEYKTYVAEKQEAFVCTAYIKIDKAEEEVVATEYKKSYEKADKDAEAQLALIKKSGVGADKSKVVAEPAKDGAKVKDDGANATQEKPAAESKITEAKTEKVEKTEQTADKKAEETADKKPARILAGEDKKTEAKADVKTEAKPAAGKLPDAPTTNKAQKIQMPHTVHMVCVYPTKNGQTESKTFKGICNTDKIEFIYKPASLTEAKNSSYALSDQDSVFIGVTDVFPYKDKNRLNFQDNTCTLNISGVNIASVLLGLALLIVNLW